MALFKFEEAATADLPIIDHNMSNFLDKSWAFPFFGFVETFDSAFKALKSPGVLCNSATR